MKEDKVAKSKGKAKAKACDGALVDLSKVSKFYKMGDTTVTALDKLDLMIKGGELLSVMGPSGSGKSTLLNIIGCIDNPTDGKVCIGGRDVSQLKDAELTKIRLTEIGFIFQQFYLIPTLTAYENIELPMREARVPNDERRKRTMELLALVGLKDRDRHYPNQLSGGEQQRVAIARALANNPILILADEPTGELDTKTGREVLELFRTLQKKRGKTLVIVTHDERIAAVSDRSVRMIDGKLAEAPGAGAPAAPSDGKEGVKTETSEADDKKAAAKSAEK
jgi:putative ABC transport system ATP-binding protein